MKQGELLARLSGDRYRKHYQPEPYKALLASHDALAHYDIDAIELPATLYDDYTNRPSCYRRVQQVFDNLTDQQWKEAIACYYARITEVDKIFGSIYDHLGEAGALENTIIIMYADHGLWKRVFNGFDFDELYNREDDLAEMNNLA